ncbi:prostatic acid phosphatase isoform X2 [Glossina fuscipes]|uniref:acid phosphatase n=1 Tax=Glossina fuscipes TaxID=7396 RepID=A0A8U0WI71_9MUSC|nr:prostatic acid phosphatase isoform X2 [Glossina fuscipes]
MLMHCLTLSRNGEVLCNSCFFLLACLIRSTIFGNNALATATSTPVADTTINQELIFAHVLYRHGDRTPIEPYPTDPWGDLKYWPTGWGQLTNIGKQQQYDLGRWLRKRYNKLLSEIYSEDEIFVRSTDVDRTLMSSLCNLAGLYQPEASDIWNPDVNWQPIPVHTMPEYMDSVLAGKAACPAYDHALSNLRNSDVFQKLNTRFGYLFNYLSKYTGRSMNSLEDLQRFNNTLYIEGLYNKTLPEWTKKVYPSSDLQFISDFTFTIGTYTRYMARLKTGPLIKEILQRFTDKVNGKLDPDRKIWMYSAHDTTIANVLNTLKLFNGRSPPYTACVLIELRLDYERQPFVSIFYKNSSTEPQPLYIPSCGTECPLRKMYTLYENILPVDWNFECKLTTLMMTYEEANIGAAMGILVIIITVMLLLSYVIMIYYRRRSYKNYVSYSQVA